MVVAAPRAEKEVFKKPCQPHWWPRRAETLIEFEHDETVMSQCLALAWRMARDASARQVCSSHLALSNSFKRAASSAAASGSLARACCSDCFSQLLVLGSARTLKIDGFFCMRILFVPPRKIHGLREFLAMIRACAHCSNTSFPLLGEFRTVPMRRNMFLVTSTWPSRLKSKLVWPSI